MTELIDYLKKTYQPLSIVVYGSCADGTSDEQSDFDALVIAGAHEETHDTSVVNGVRLDVFVYPVSAFEDEVDCDEFLQIADGRVVLDDGGYGAKLLERVREHIAGLPRKTRAEIAEELAWCRKMLMRAERRDPEGMFRLHWLLADSLEIYCDVTGAPYLGPKKSLARMEREHPDAFALYTKALSETSAPSCKPWLGWLEAHA